MTSCSAAKSEPEKKLSVAMPRHPHHAWKKVVKSRRSDGTLSSRMADLEEDGQRASSFQKQSTPQVARTKSKCQAGKTAKKRPGYS